MHRVMKLLEKMGKRADDIKDMEREMQVALEDYLADSKFQCCFHLHHCLSQSEIERFEVK